MNIPADNKADCPHCAGKARAYADDCRQCLIRRIAHLPILHRSELYDRLVRDNDRMAMMRVSDEVAQYHRQNFSWGTFAK